jgi:hypothetical protein
MVARERDARSISGCRPDVMLFHQRAVFKSGGRQRSRPANPFRFVEFSKLPRHLVRSTFQLNGRPDRSFACNLHVRTVALDTSSCEPKLVPPAGIVPT